MKALQKENIQVVLRQNDKGVIYGITYVDHRIKCVFNGSHLGKQYSANAIQQRCAAAYPATIKEEPLTQSFKNETAESTLLTTGLSKLFDDLLQPENNQSANEPPEQRKFKKKEKENNSNRITKKYYISMNTGENEQGLRKIIDLTRMISTVVLLLHFYFYVTVHFQSGI
jgi:hypothetical protein